MKDSLGDRMKRQYEDRTRYMLPRRTYTIIRCDGQAFHSYTRQCEKPYDARVVMAMNMALFALCEEIQGATFGYVQSDEISIVAGDFRTIDTAAWFDGNVQKIVSVAASIATEAFNAQAAVGGLPPEAHFDARVFTIPDPIEVVNYFIWRQQDATRNSIQGLAQAHFSAQQLHGVSNKQAQDMLFAQCGVNWNDRPVGDKRGRACQRVDSAWRLDTEPPVFTEQRDYVTLPRCEDAATDDHKEPS